MPKSRGRRTRKNRRTASHRTSGSQPNLELRHLAGLLGAADAAEARGDAAGALEVMAAPVKGWPDDRVFWRPWRVRTLEQVVMLGQELPGWATSRWILAQALQCLDSASRSRVSRAVAIAVDARGGAQTLHGVDEVDARCKVIDHDWIFRQVHLYELGGLEHFIRRVASPDLVVGADHIHDWARTPMCGFRLLRGSRRSSTWERLDTGEEVDALDLGTAMLLAEGECAIGRLVPIEDGVMFETAPLPVPEIVAEQVASEPAHWVGTVRRGARALAATGSELITSGLHDYPLLTDVSEGLWRAVARDVAAPTRGTARRGRPGDVMQEAAGLVRVALEGELPRRLEGELSVFDPWPCVAAALVEPGVVEHLLGTLGPGDALALRRLAHELTDPAASLCQRMARDLRESA